MDKHFRKITKKSIFQKQGKPGTGGPDIGGLLKDCEVDGQEAVKDGEVLAPKCGDGESPVNDVITCKNGLLVGSGEISIGEDVCAKGVCLWL